jgi:hypothetical protein
MGGVAEKQTQLVVYWGRPHVEFSDGPFTVTYGDNMTLHSLATTVEHFLVNEEVRRGEEQANEGDV